MAEARGPTQGMTYQDNFGALLPSRWKSANAGPVVDVEATACLS